MASIFGGRKPDVQSGPTAPERTSQQIADAAAAQRDRIYGAAPGRVSAMLTGGSGVAGSEVNTSVARLLGNVGR